ncbi:MAG: transposase, partial [Oligoflexales bacterium]|nr:transposase [Oligoflexales bacterium]
MAKIKRVPAETKIEIVKAHLLDKKPVSELSEAHGISPKNIYLWQNQLFSNGEACLIVCRCFEDSSSISAFIECAIT